MASNLRLNCNNFLINKRLIFQGKVQYIINRQPFSKTHAQHRGVIDVNKASQMFSYFEAAGWMEEGILSQFVVQEIAKQQAEKELDMKREDSGDMKVV